MIHTINITLKVETDKNQYYYSPAEKVEGLFNFGTMQDALSEVGLYLVSVKVEDISTDNIFSSNESHPHLEHMNWEDDGGAIISHR